MDVTSCVAILFNPNHQIHPIENIKAVKSRFEVLTIFCIQIILRPHIGQRIVICLYLISGPMGRRPEKSAESDRLIYLDSKF